MKSNRALGLASAMVAVMACGSASAVISSPAVIWGNPAVSLQWKTVMTNAMDLALCWPADATKATLSVKHGKKTESVDLTDTSASACAFNVQFPSDERAEAVLELTLAYKDPTDAVLATETARLGLVRGINVNTARCVLDATARVWNRAKDSAVLPIPEGTASLTIDGVSVEPIDAPGWYQWNIGEQRTYDFVLTTDAGTTTTTVEGRKTLGATVIFF